MLVFFPATYSWCPAAAPGAQENKNNAAKCEEDNLIQSVWKLRFQIELIHLFPWHKNRESEWLVVAWWLTSRPKVVPTDSTTSNQIWNMSCRTIMTVCDWAKLLGPSFRLLRQQRLVLSRSRLWTLNSALRRGGRAGCRLLKWKENEKSAFFRPPLA